MNRPSSPETAKTDVDPTADTTAPAIGQSLVVLHQTAELALSSQRMRRHDAAEACGFEAKLGVGR